MLGIGKPKRASTVAIDEGRVARHVIPLIGKKVAGDLTYADVQRMCDAIAAGKTAGVFKTKARGKAVVEGGAGTAARVAELLDGAWTWAAKRPLVAGENPVKGVQKHKGDAKERTLSAPDLARLGATLRENEHTRPAAVAALRLIALTGLRREEAWGLRWSELDAANACRRMEKTIRSIVAPEILRQLLHQRADEQHERRFLGVLANVGIVRHVAGQAGGSADLRQVHDPSVPRAARDEALFVHRARHSLRRPAGVLGPGVGLRQATANAAEHRLTGGGTVALRQRKVRRLRKKGV